MEYEEMISEKKLVDKFVRELACKKMKFTASYISKKIDVDLDFVKKRLIKLSNDGQLVINFDVVCPHKCNHEIIGTYTSLNNVPMGKLVECKCGNKFMIANENVYVTFSPNEKYFDNEMCKKKL
jgi:hypothetical protein